MSLERDSDRAASRLPVWRDPESGVEPASRSENSPPPGAPAPSKAPDAEPGHRLPELNYYGQPITPPEYFDGEHVANPMGAGLPPVCSCGWTRHSGFEMADHLRDMAL